jgi:hypothetical protein
LNIKQRFLYPCNNAFLSASTGFLSVERITVKISHYGIIAVFIVVIAVALAGCTFNKTIGTTTTSSGTTGSSSSSGQAASASATAATCPAVTAATSWTGKWTGMAVGPVCKDLRTAFYPATADNPDPWTNAEPVGALELPITFTQTGCAVTGSATIVRSGCPVTFTGTVDSTGALSGTWKAYCDLTFGSIYTSKDNTADNGVFNLNMEPGGSTFIGEMMIHTPDLDQAKAKECPNGNSNFVGKRG